jgi:hypothetical protein
MTRDAGNATREGTFMANTLRTGAMASSNGSKTEGTTQRHVLPIPDVTPIGLTTFDAKDPDTS